MTWARLDDGFYDHPKARAVGKDGRALFLAAVCHSALNLTDGFIAESDLPLLAAKAEVKGALTARRLIEAALWHATEGGWEIHDYLAYNPPSEKVKESREAASERQRKWRESRRDKPVTNGVSSPSPSTTRPDPKGLGSFSGSSVDGDGSPAPSGGEPPSVFEEMPAQEFAARVTGLRDQLRNPQETV